jgi:uncharacterized protein YlxP (DUF503 family)
LLVGVCTLELRLLEADNLKDKRRVLKSIRDRVRNRYNVSIAEVDHQDSHKLATLALAMVSNAAQPIHQTFNEIIRGLSLNPEAELLSHQVEIY